MPESEVRAHLAEVELFLGGPAAHTPWNAVTIGHDIYVRSQAELEAIESWGYRRWLSHECGHVMQYARTPESLGDTGRVRQYLGAYVGTCLSATDAARERFPPGSDIGCMRISIPGTRPRPISRFRTPFTTPM